MAALAGFLGALGGIGALNALTGSVILSNQYFYSPLFLIPLYLTIFAFTSSLLLFSISLRQISIISFEKFEKNTISGWAGFFAKKLDCLEKQQRWAGVAFIIGVVSFLVILSTLLVQQVLRLLC